MMLNVWMDPQPGKFRTVAYNRLNMCYQQDSEKKLQYRDIAGHATTTNILTF